MSSLDLFFFILITIRHAERAVEAGKQRAFQKETNIHTYLVLKNVLTYFQLRIVGPLLQIWVVHSNIAPLFHNSFECEVQTIFPRTLSEFQIHHVQVFVRNNQMRTIYKCTPDRCIQSIGWLQMQRHHLDQSLFRGISLGAVRSKLETKLDFFYYLSFKGSSQFVCIKYQQSICFCKT